MIRDVDILIATLRSHIDGMKLYDIIIAVGGGNVKKRLKKRRKLLKIQKHSQRVYGIMELPQLRKEVLTMKLQKALSLTLGTLLLTSALALPASAMKAIGNVNVPYGSPKIDGKIDAAEWKNAGTFTVDSTTAKSWHNKFPENFSADIRVMWDETNLYLTGTIKDPNVSFSTEGKYNRDRLTWDRHCSTRLKTVQSSTPSAAMKMVRVCFSVRNQRTML